MLEMGEFAKFIAEFIRIYNEEQEDKHLWDLFIHSYTEDTFEQFKEKHKKPKGNQPTQADVKAAIEQTRQILNDFNPLE